MSKHSVLRRVQIQTRTGPHVPSHSEDESSHPILINTAQNVYERELNVIDNPKDPPNSERECNSNVWILEMIELVIQKLQDITDMGWQLKSEYDDCIKVLNAKLREQDSLIDQLKDQTVALMQELKGSTTEVHQFYDDFSLHMNDSIKSVQAFKDMSLHICNNATTASSEREEIKKSQDASRWRECWTQNRKGKGLVHNAW